MVNVCRTVFFGEFKRVTFAKKLTEEEAKPFISLDFIDASSWLLPPPEL